MILQPKLKRINNIYIYIYIERERERERESNHLFGRGIKNKMRKN